MQCKVKQSVSADFGASKVKWAEIVPGIAFLVPVGDEQWVPGVVTHALKRPGLIGAFAPIIVTRNISADELTKGVFVHDGLYMQYFGGNAILSEMWPVIGKLPLPHRLTKMPVVRCDDGVFEGYEFDMLRRGKPFRTFPSDRMPIENSAAPAKYMELYLARLVGLRGVEMPE